MIEKTTSLSIGGARRNAAPLNLQIAAYTVVDNDVKFGYPQHFFLIHLLNFQDIFFYTASYV